MASVVIAAHNEAAVIGRCLAALARQEGAGPLDVVVVPNGCRDDTAAVAERHGAVVVPVRSAGKSAALVVGDATATGFPRIYLDADIELPPHAVHAAERVFAEDPSVLAAAPRRRVDASRSSALVRAYFAVSQRLPAYENSLFGRGMIVLSEAGRSRFDTFPLLLADDLFLDSLYTSQEKRPVEDVVVVIAAPLRARPLVRRLIRVRRGNAELRAGHPVLGTAGVRRSDRFAWLTAVVLPNPRLAPAGLVYVTITLLAAALAKAARGSRPAWGQDETTRTSVVAAGPEAEVRGTP